MAASLEPSWAADAAKGRVWKSTSACTVALGKANPGYRHGSGNLYGMKALQTVDHLHA
jgi:hypothetical protein